jgi:hypothetical protein
MKEQWQRNASNVPQQQQALWSPSHNSIHLSWTALPLLGRSQLSLLSTESKKQFFTTKHTLEILVKDMTYVKYTASRQSCGRNCQCNPHLQAVQQDRCPLRLSLASTVPSYRRHTHFGLPAKVKRVRCTNRAKYYF